MPKRKLSPQTKRVLAEFLEAPNSCLYGYELLKKTGLRPGSLYTILNRLDDQGILTSEWRGMDLDGNETRPHRVYKLTREGQEYLLSKELAQLFAQGTKETPEKHSNHVTQEFDETSDRDMVEY